MRPITADAISLALTAKEWADEQVAEFFVTWCRLSGTHAAYGVESWRIWGSDLQLVQDTSRRGCHDTKSHTFPLAWLLATGPEREALILASVEQKKAAEALQREEKRVRELSYLRARLADLEANPKAS